VDTQVKYVNYGRKEMNTKIAKNILLDRTCNNCKHRFTTFYAGDSLSQSTTKNLCNVNNKSHYNTCAAWEDILSEYIRSC
jgi:transcriptional regulator NrdR family protein